MTDEQGRKILLVGHGVDPDGLSSMLDDKPFEVIHVPTSDEARDMIEERGLPHLMIIDLDLPKGFALCQEMYDLTGLPIIAVSEDTSPDQAVTALQYADDFVRKSFVDTHEIVMRVRRILSRINDFSYATGPKLTINDWLELDPLQREVSVRGETRKLTPIENALLQELIKHRGDVVNATTLIERVWHSDPTANDRNVLRVHIHRLRQKLEREPNSPRVILTERGIGYTFADI